MKIQIHAKLALTITSLIFCLLIEGRGQSVQYVTIASLSGSNPIPIQFQSNQVVSVVGYTPSVSVTATFTNGVIISMGSGALGAFNFTGLASAVVNGVTSTPGAVTFKITTVNCQNVISNYVPADAIVIPASANGNVQVILESSPDLVNWTAAEPGIYGASAGTNRFFRVIAQVQ